MRNAPSSTTGRPILSQTAEHALRASLYLGRRAGDGLVAASDVAQALGTPPNYTAKTLRQLTRKGLLRSVRGPHGGFELLADPRELSVARLIAAVDEAVERPAICLLGDHPCDGGRPCGAHRLWMEVQERTNELMERTTLADLLDGEPAPSPPGSP